jgi:subtilase family serine protease
VNVNTLNQVIPIGGTSAACPMWGGVWALVDQAKGGKGITDGITRLYATAKATPTAFNDITSGDNGGPDGKSAGYPATVGYDLATGWGTPNAANLTASFQ